MIEKLDTNGGDAQREASLCLVPVLHGRHIVVTHVLQVGIQRSGTL